jgi:hypothetical protein
MIYIINILIILIHCLILKTLFNILHFNGTNILYWIILFVYVFIVTGYEYIYLNKWSNKKK